MSRQAGALAWAETQVAAARDDPSARLALLVRTYHGPTGRAPRHLPFRRAALSFMRWQAHRGVLNPLDASPPGSVWWRAVNERLLRDGCEAVALVGALPGAPSSQAVRLWLEFIARPTARNWYRSHNASIVSAYLAYQRLAEPESAPERFFMNVALARVLYTHAVVAAPRLALGRLGRLGRVVGDPRLGMAGVFLSLCGIVMDRFEPDPTTTSAPPSAWSASPSSCTPPGIDRPLPTRRSLAPLRFDDVPGDGRAREREPVRRRRLRSDRPRRPVDFPDT